MNEVNSNPPSAGATPAGREVVYRLVVNPDKAFLGRCGNQLAVAGEEVPEIHTTTTG